MSPLSRAIAAVAFLVNLGDVVLHVAIAMVEPLRVTGNIVVLLTIAVIALLARVRRPALAAFAGALSIALNVVFIAQSGIGTLGAVLVVLTTLLMLALALSLRPALRQA